MKLFRTSDRQFVPGCFRYFLVSIDQTWLSSGADRDFLLNLPTLTMPCVAMLPPFFLGSVMFFLYVATTVYRVIKDYVAVIGQEWITQTSKIQKALVFQADWIEVISKLIILEQFWIGRHQVHCNVCRHWFHVYLLLSESININVGGPVWSMSWCPVDVGQFDHQYLAVYTNKTFDETHLVRSQSQSDVLLQIYDCGILNSE
jgi:hypothetical protein